MFYESLILFNGETKTIFGLLMPEEVFLVGYANDVPTVIIARMVEVTQMCLN